MKTKLIPMLIALAIGALVAGGCGGDEENEQTGATAPMTEGESVPPTDQTETDAGGDASDSGEQLEIPADPGGALEFEKEQVTAKAGQVTLTMPNESNVPHAIGVRGDGVDETGETVTKGGESMVSVELTPGEYTFYCPVPGHEEAGMKGTLTVE